MTKSMTLADLQPLWSPKWHSGSLRYTFIGPAKPFYWFALSKACSRFGFVEWTADIGGAMKKINLSLIVLFRWLFLVLLMTGCASGEVKQASVAMPDSEPVLTVKWLPPCWVEADEPYFSVDVDKDGNVSYLGGSQAKEIGHRFIKIERKDVQRLASVARALLRSSESSRETAFHEKKVRDDGEDYSYCISLALRDGALKRDGRFTSDAGRTQTLIETIRSIINEERWVCPVRESYEIRS